MSEKQDQPKFCANCGQPWEAGSRFCGECGQAFESVTGPEQAQPLPVLPDQPAPESIEGKQNPSKRRGLVIAIVVLIGGLGLAYVGYITDFFGLAPVREVLITGSVPQPLPKAPDALPKKAQPAPVKKSIKGFNKAKLSQYVSLVLFFESGSPPPPKVQRVYKNNFSAYQTRYINWELNLKNPAAQSRTDFNIDAVWFRPDGSIHARETMHAYVLPGWNNSFHTSGWGNKNAGTWFPGGYHVDFYVEGQKIASSGFTIY